MFYSVLYQRVISVLYQCVISVLYQCVINVLKCVIIMCFISVLYAATVIVYLMIRRNYGENVEFVANICMLTELH